MWVRRMDRPRASGRAGGKGEHTEGEEDKRAVVGEQRKCRRER